MRKLFGTDGIRGEAGEFPLDPATVEILGRSLSSLFERRLGRQPRFVTGRDTRESGGWIEAALHAGFISAGAACESAGVTTTPGVAFLAVVNGYDAGIVISASHNPFADNGIKVFLGTGQKLDEESERSLERSIYEALESFRPAHNVTPDDSSAYEFVAEYKQYLTSEFEDLSLKGLRVAVDCANGAASHIAPQLFEELGAEVVAIHCAPDGRNINLDCGSMHMGPLQSAVVESGAHIGVAFDGDADRSLFVDEKGDVVDGDGVLWIMAKCMERQGMLGKHIIVSTVMSNVGLEIALRDRGIELLRADVGDKYVLERLLQTGAAVGGEQSGHIIFPHRSLVGDGMMTALYLFEAMRSENASLSELLEGFQRYPQVLVNVKVREKRPFEDMSEVVAEIAKVESALEGNGRLLLRYSGTENLARVMIEGRDQDAIESLAGGLAEVIRSTIG